MAGFTYKSYSFIDKDPIIDLLRTIINKSDLSIAKISYESGVNHQTILKWLYGETKMPKAATLNAVLRVLDYKLDIVALRQTTLIQPTRVSNVVPLKSKKVR